jgi:uncharacterized protein (DUF362 family)
VALARRDDRRATVGAALEGVADHVDLSGARRVLVKPNFVSTDNALAATHVDAVRAVLEFVRARYDGPLVVAEGAALSPTGRGFRHFGYEALRQDYDVALVDLNADETRPVQVYNRRLRPMTLALARTVVEADYRISVGPPKTHDGVLVTLSIKNMVMGSLVNPSAVRSRDETASLLHRLSRLLMPGWVWHSPLAEWAKRTIVGRMGGSNKMCMHQGWPALNLNLALVAPHVWPHLAVIDGWRGMEGEGPAAGEPVEWRLAVAGTDALAVDVLTASLMGFDPRQVGYLDYCGRMGLGTGTLDQIEGCGDLAPEQARRPFRPHPTWERQLRWQLAGAERYLALSN